LQNGSRFLVHADLLRPVPAVAGQGDPVGRIHVYRQAESCAIGAGIEHEQAGPRALVAAGIRHLIGEKRAVVLRHVMQDPVLPVLQRWRHLLRQQRQGKQQPETQQSQ
jgi:hypothetical protein